MPQIALRDCATGRPRVLVVRRGLNPSVGDVKLPGRFCCARQNDFFALVLTCAGGVATPHILWAQAGKLFHHQPALAVDGPRPWLRAAVSDQAVSPPRARG